MHAKDYICEALKLEYELEFAYKKLKEDNFFCKQIYEIRHKGITLLLSLNGDFSYHPKGDIEPNIESLIVAEERICEFYNSACQNIDNDSVKDLFFRLWATSNNEYLPTLKSCSSAKNRGFNLDNFSFLTKDMEKFIDEAKKIVSGKANPAEIKNALNDPNFGFFCGVAAGGLLAMSVKEFIKEKEEDEPISK